MSHKLLIAFLVISLFVNSVPALAQTVDVLSQTQAEVIELQERLLKERAKSAGLLLQEAINQNNIVTLTGQLANLSEQLRVERSQAQDQTVRHQQQIEVANRSYSQGLSTAFSTGELQGRQNGERVKVSSKLTWFFLATTVAATGLAIGAQTRVNGMCRDPRIRCR